MSYNTWQNYVLEQPAIDEEQKRRLLELVAMPGPEFNPTLARDLTLEARGKGAEWLSGTPDAPKALMPYMSGESRDYANTLSHVSDMLRMAKENYGANQMDIDRALSRNKDAFNTYLGKIGMAFDTGSSIGSRRTQSTVSEIGRQGDYASMQANYKRMIERLQQQADEAKRRGDMDAWISILGTIATIVGMAV